MDSLKVERWQTDLDKFQKRAAELRAEVLVETAEGNDEVQLQQAQKLLALGVKVLVLVPHDAGKAVRIVSAAKARKVPLLCYERLVAIRTSVLYWGRRLGSWHDAGNFPLSAGPKRKLRLDRRFSVG